MGPSQPTRGTKLSPAWYYIRMVSALQRCSTSTDKSWLLTQSWRLFVMQLSMPSSGKIAVAFSCSQTPWPPPDELWTHLSTWVRDTPWLCVRPYYHGWQLTLLITLHSSTSHPHSNGIFIMKHICIYRRSPRCLVCTLNLLWTAAASRWLTSRSLPGVGCSSMIQPMLVTTSCSLRPWTGSHIGKYPGTVIYSLLGIYFCTVHHGAIVD